MLERGDLSEEVKPVSRDAGVIVARYCGGNLEGAGPVVIGGDFNNLGDASSPMFSGLRAAGFANSASTDPAGAVAARRPIDWIFAKGVSARSAIVRAPDASDHDPVIAQTFVQQRF